MNKLFVSAYEQARDNGIQVVRMNEKQLAGYYLYHFPMRPMDAILHDQQQGLIPNTTAAVAKTLIQASILK